MKLPAFARGFDDGGHPGRAARYRLPERWAGPVRMLLLLGPALAWFVNWTSMGG